MERLTKKDSKYITPRMANSTEMYLSLCMNKLSQLEDIEQELGIGLSVLFKAIKEGAYYKLNQGQVDSIDGISLCKCTSGWFIHFEYKGIDICLDTIYYGITWALTKEELL